MKIVIDIDEKLACEGFERPFTNEEVNILLRAIGNGTPLPKDYGKLMILSKDKLKENLMDLDFSCQKWISEVGLSNAIIAIIETDSGEEG